MRSFTSRWRWSMAAVLLLAGCAKPPPPPPPPAPPPAPIPIGCTVDADEKVNPDIAGRPSPVAVKLFQLQTAGKFEAGDFFTLYRDAAAALGPDLVASREVTVRPGEQKRFDEEIAPQTRFVGIVVGFRDVQNARWRAVVAVPATGLAQQALEVRLAKLAASASFVEAKAAASGGPR